jgi:DNA-binding NtrC family response regulator
MVCLQPAAQRRSFRGDSKVARATVLIVEPEPAVARVVTRVLELAGYRVVVAVDADEALSQLAECPNIELLLTEVVVRHGSGAKLAKRVAIDHPYLGTILMSGDMDDVLERHGVTESEVEFLRKPFCCDDLLRAVARVDVEWHQAA